MPRPPRDANLTPQRAVARAFLLHHLRAGERQAGALIEQAAAAGIHVRTLRRAAADLGVIVEASGGGEGRQWWWRLPESRG